MPYDIFNAYGRLKNISICPYIDQMRRICRVIVLVHCPYSQGKPRVHRPSHPRGSTGHKLKLYLYHLVPTKQCQDAETTLQQINPSLGAYFHTVLQEVSPSLLYYWSVNQWCNWLFPSIAGSIIASSNSAISLVCFLSFFSEVRKTLSFHIVPWVCTLEKATQNQYKWLPFFFFLVSSFFLFLKVCI